MKGLVAVIATMLATGGVMADHPSLYLTPGDVERGKVNIERYAWAKDFFQAAKSEADKWAAKSEEEIRGLVPEPKALFAYGFSGCPSCGVTWTTWGNGGLCDFALPRKVKCTSCGRIFPDEEHPDQGDGWLDPKTGRRHYFVAQYNAFVAQRLTLDVPANLANAYALTGDEKYARTAAIVFDALARIYPTCTVGSIDYPGHPGGRFERTQYQVARVLVLLANDYDLIYNSPALDAPSQAGEATIRKSIEERILKNAAAYCFQQGNTGNYGLTNGEADYVRGVLAVGLLLGIQEYVDWALEGPYCVFNFLENNLHHDGQYYETSVGYSQHALNLYVDMAEMLANYRSPKYPNGINLYTHPKLSKALVQGQLDVICAGHSPRFGDSGPDVKELGEGNPYLPYMHIAAERLYRRTDDKARWAEVMNRICGGKVEEWRANAPFRTWLTFHAEPISDFGLRISDSRKGPEPESSHLLDGKGLAILRAGAGKEGEAALVRYGPSVCHGHMDDLNLNFFALGRELTYDLGYSLGSAHVQTGWSKQTAGHNLVVVNEKSQIRGGPSGGSAHLFAESDAVKMAELSSEGSYASEGVSLYRRTIALIPGGDQSYLVDIFRVSGGQTHDLIWHGLGDKLTIEGAELGDVQPGSLAGPDTQWGKQVGPDGDITGQADKGPYWTAPPQNGYGFLCDVRRGSSKEKVDAEWAVSEGTMFRITMFPPSGSEVISAQGPAILPALPKANYAIIRRKGENLASTFVSVLQPYEKTNPVESIERLEGDDGAVGLRIKLRNRTDYLLSALAGVHDFGDKVRLDGRFGFLSFENGSLAHALITWTSSLSAGGLAIKAERASYWGEVKGVDYENCRLVVNRELPSAIVGSRVYLNRRDYSHKSCYVITAVNRERGGSIVTLDTGTLVLGKGHVSADADPGTQAIKNLVPLEMSTSCNRTDTGYFRGKLLLASDGTSACIENVQAAGGKRTILVPDASKFRKGQDLTIYDIQAGDSFEIPTTVTIDRAGSSLVIEATTPGTVEIGGKRADFSAGKTTIR